MRGTVEDWRRQAMEHHRAGRFQSAAEAWAKAATVDPNHPETKNNLGVALQSLGKLDDAAKAFADATRLRPTYGDAWENLAGVLIGLNRLDDAIDAGRQMVRHLPNTPASHVVLATTLARAGQFDEAAASCRNGLAVSPDNPDVLYLLANVLAAQQRWTDAATAYAKVLELCPTVLNAQVNLGVCLAGSGNLIGAAEQFRQVLARDGSRADAALRLADVLDRLGQQDEALEAAKRAAELRPNDPAALNLFASFTDRARHSNEAAALYERALAIAPGHTPALANYATLLTRRGEIERAMPMLKRAVDAEPGEPVMHSSLCMYLSAMPGVDPREVYAEHRRWDERHTPSPGTPGEGGGEGSSLSINKEDPHPSPLPAYRERGPAGVARLKIGYISPDWAGHPVARFMQPILELHDRAAFEIHVYDDAPRPDAFTELLRPLAHTWHRVRGMPDEALAAKIREDRIDVLVDLAGHTAGNRLLVFARRAAPVQVNYLGYANTTGLDAMDYRLTDAIADPPGLADELHSEKLIRLPGCFLTFRPPVETPGVSDAPVFKNGFVTFGSFNALWKINTALIELWSRVLAAVPDSRMLLKAAGLEDAAVAERITTTFGRFGVAPNRLQLIGREKTYRGHLDTYGECDVCLDTFPYAGTTTTCEALWMGVPVISLAGQTHASRVGASLLSSVGWADLVAASPEAFVAIASELAGNPDRIRSLRQSARERLQTSPLMDPVGLTRAIEAAFCRISAM